MSINSKGVLQELDRFIEQTNKRYYNVVSNDGELIIKVPRNRRIIDNEQSRLF